VSTASKQRGIYAALVRRPVAVGVLFLTLILMGLIAYARIPLQMMPEGFSGTRLTVMISHPGSSASENEEKVARVIEEQFRTLPNLKNISSRSGEGSVNISVSFNGSSDMGLAKAELRDRIERARPNLPSTVDRIFVWAHNDGDLPVMFLGFLISERTAEMDYLLEHEIQRRIEAVDGVSRVQVWGTLEDSVRILLDEDKVRASRLNLGNLVAALMRDNFAQPMGEITDGGRRFLLRSDMRMRSFAEIENYPIRKGLRLKDVAKVVRVKTVRDQLTRIDGRDAYYGMIQKESTANMVEVSHSLRDLFEEFGTDPKLMGKIDVAVFFDQAKFIEVSLSQLSQTALWGGGLSIIILLMFLRRVRMTLCVALSIPASALLAITWEHFTGGSFNVLTMTGLTLGIGMLVDNSVVVMESIARQRAEGKDPVDAAVAGVRDVGLAISLATLTTVVVFLPLIFMGGDPILRVMLGAMGLPLCVSLLISLVVALIFLPVVSARILGERSQAAQSIAQVMGRVMQVPVRVIAVLISVPRAAFHLGLTLAHRTIRLGLGVLVPLRWPLAAALLGAGALALERGGPIRELAQQMNDLGVPASNAGYSAAGSTGAAVGSVIAALLLVFAAPRWRKRPALPPRRPPSLRPQGISILLWIQEANRALLIWTLQHRLLATLAAVGALASVSIPLGGMSVTAFGREEDSSQIEIRVDMEDNFTLAEASEEVAHYERVLEGLREELGFKHLIARFRVGGGQLELQWVDRPGVERMEAARARLREELQPRPGHKLIFSRETGMDVASRQFIHFQLRGTDPEQLEQFGMQAVQILREIPGLIDVITSLEDAPEQVRLKIDREAAATYGVTSNAAIQSLTWALRGAALPRYQDVDRELPLIIEYDGEEMAGLDTLRDLNVFTANSVVPLSAFSEIEFQPGAGQIHRWNGRITFDIQARVDNPSRQTELVKAGYAALQALELPRGFSLGMDDSAAARQAEEVDELTNALLLSIVLVFLLMGILFESLLLPISVLTTIPFAVLGALWTIYLTGTTMDSVGFVGLIILVGVVVNNGIVLIDKIHRSRSTTASREEAVLAGSAARVRPILMTALTTVFGLLPMALSTASNDGIDYRALATCVAGGLVISTFFTLWIVPLAYTVMDDLTHSLGGTLRSNLQRVRKRT
jgi:HAE1 family hydrophobic/amphiphilic exporter-1